MTEGNGAPWSSYFTLPEQGYRSANLLLDHGDAAIIRSYLPTGKSVAVLDALLEGLEEGQRDRAISLVAPYGSGKTSLLLFLCALLGKEENTLSAVREVLERVRTLSSTTISAIRKHLRGHKGYVSVFLSGDERELPPVFDRALEKALHHYQHGEIWQRVYGQERDNQASEALSSGDRVSIVLQRFRTVADELKKAGYKGLLVIYDEFGKVLEAQQTASSPQDLFFIQSFAELCSRSGTAQIHLILSLHQEFAQYAHRLPIYVRHEWAKIEGRFRTLHFIEHSLQVYELIAQAIRRLRTPSTAELAETIQTRAELYAHEAARVPGLAAIKPEEARIRLFQEVFPLDPLALYVLPRLSARVAQNERTLFHFLLGQEQGCLYQILQARNVANGQLPFVRVADLFKYFADLMLKDTGIGGTYRRLIEINTALDRVGSDNEVARDFVKTIGILSIVGEVDMVPPTEEVLRYAWGAFTDTEEATLNSVLDRLVAAKILLHRRHTQEYRIWEGSDIDLLGLLRQKKAEFELHFNLVEFLTSRLPASPVFAHRYNEDFSITRFFEGSFASVVDLKQMTDWESVFASFQGIDGKIYYVIAESGGEIEDALQAARELQHRQILFAIPKRPLNFTEPLLELYCLEHLLADSQFVF